MVGVVLALISAAAFGGNSIITRRGMLRVSANYVATLTIFTGPAFFFIIAAFTGDLFKLGEYSWQAFLFMTISGVGHFALGRSWGYRSIQLIGSTRSNIVTSLNPVITTILAMAILGETMSLLMAIGIVCTLAGPLLILTKEEVLLKGSRTPTAQGKNEVNRGTLVRGILYGAGSAVFWGSSAIFIKLGLEHGSSPIGGSFIAYTAASLAILPSSFLNRSNRREILRWDRESLGWVFFSGMTTNVAQLMRYLALEFGSAIIVSLMLRTVPLWVLLFAFIFMRQYESFSRWVLLGNGLIMAGTILVLIA